MLSYCVSSDMQNIFLTPSKKPTHTPTLAKERGRGVLEREFLWSIITVMLQQELRKAESAVADYDTNIPRYIIITQTKCTLPSLHSLLSEDCSISAASRQLSMKNRINFRSVRSIPSRFAFIGIEQQ
jgi:hypothetical protein